MGCRIERLTREHVKRRATQLTASERRGHRLVVYQSASADVDEKRAALHHRERVGIDQLTSFRRQRRGEDDDVTRREQLVQPIWRKDAVRRTTAAARRRACESPTRACRIPTRPAQISRPIEPSPMMPIRRCLKRADGPTRLDFVQRPLMVALLLHHPRKLAGQRDGHPDHVLRDRTGANPSGASSARSGSRSSRRRGCDRHRQQVPAPISVV